MKASVLDEGIGIRGVIEEVRRIVRVLVEGQESPAERPAVCVVLKEGRGIWVPEYGKRGRDVLKGLECHEGWK
jgi:hypothetical protein